MSIKLKVGLHKQRIVTITTLLMIGLLWFTFSNSQLPIEGSPSSAGTKSDLFGGLSANEKNDDASGTIMPKMPDQEAKKALGRASWKYFHTLLARFPDEPTEQEKTKLREFLYLYAELYPCGECSYHFVKMLKKYPPQVASRTTAALWGCHIHNLVNDHLEKPRYDCNTILEDYDCGCTDENGNIDPSLNMNKVTLNKEEKQLG
ncbi:Erv2 [Kluyveromyces lactis]|nr:Erv2 [Kluyveromyces lactis]